MNIKRSLLVFSIAAGLALLGAAWLAPQPALARSGGGTGRLTASGDGLAGLRGDGTVSISGNGVLWIRDHNGDAVIQVSGSGVRRETANGWIRYVGFDGSATVTGSLVTVALSGYDISLAASGTGKFVLRGDGSYSVEKDGVAIATGAWTESAEVMTIP